MSWAGSRSASLEGPAELVAAYIRAKDSNRPHLAREAFAADATLEMIVNAGTIAFPPLSKGRDAIVEVLVSRFGQTFENVYTFCLSPPPGPGDATFTCAWLVGMSEKLGGATRVGWGRYDWSFRRGDEPCIDCLTITIEQMHTLPASSLETVMHWLSGLPYPWCSHARACRDAPPGIAEELRRSSSGERVLLVLDDDRVRLAGFDRILPSLGTDWTLRTWRDAGSMLAAIEAVLDQAQLISLDHDLYRDSPSDPDPGCGRMVADFLSRHPPVCPVVLHSTNTEAAWGMFNALSSAGWAVAIVHHLNEDGWIEARWLPVARSVLHPEAVAEP